MRAFLNGGTIHYTEAGNADGLPVIFVHGFPFSHAMWHQQMDAVGGAGYRAIAYDIRGHGLSDVGDGQYTIESHVDDLIAFLDHLKIQTAVLCGLSMGGYITLRALQRNPDRFLGAVLCDTRSEADANDGKIRRALSAATVKRTGSATFADDWVKIVFAPSTLAMNPAPVAAIRSVIAHTPPLSIAGTLIALAARTDTTAMLPSITIPTLIMVGEHDVPTPPDAARSMHEKIRGSELQIVPDAGHMSNLENPAFFNASLLRFLDRVRTTR